MVEAALEETSREPRFVGFEGLKGKKFPFGIETYIGLNSDDPLFPIMRGINTPLKYFWAIQEFDSSKRKEKKEDLAARLSFVMSFSNSFLMYCGQREFLPEDNQVVTSYQKALYHRQELEDTLKRLYPRTWVNPSEGF